MKRMNLNVLVTATLFGLAPIAFADEAQPELQPRADSSWYKRPVETTTFNPAVVNEERSPYRFLVDFSPL